MKYEATVESLSGRRRPAWFDDEKFGIFIHWGAYSVPAYAPIGDTDIAGLFRKGDLAAVFRNQPYAEWYLNSIRIPDSPAAEYHRTTYGAGYRYEEFSKVFNDHISGWDPSDWARLFRESGAGYVTLVTKHHDGFLLWPSRHPNPHAPEYRASRNIVGELTEAVRGEGMRMNYYYSSLLDWSFTDKPILDFVDLQTLSPTTREYVEYQEAHWRELIADYRPSVLWSDIGYPPGSDLLKLFADFYNEIDDGLVNDRWNQVGTVRRRIMRLPGMRGKINRAAAKSFAEGSTAPMMPPHYDFTTPEYTSLDHITTSKWEANRGVGRSFAYNQFEPDEFYLTLPDLVGSFVDIISKNGNLLLNVGPTSTGEIPQIQRRLLEGFGKWMADYRQAVHGSRPWKRFGDDDDSGATVRFTRSGDDLNLFLFPRGESAVTVRNLHVPVNARPVNLATGKKVAFEQEAGAVRFHKLKEDESGTCVVVIPGGA
ncbi:MAG: alpha-L-fucosidase [Spirochaetia bacterium]